MTDMQWPHSSLLLGAWRHAPDFPWQPIRCDGRRWPHALVLGTSGAGKTFSTFYPTLLGSWFDSTVVLDPKGDIYKRTAGYRSRFGRVVRIAPHEPGSGRYNPLDGIRPPPYSVADALNIAEILAPSAGEAGGKSRDPFFDTAAKPLVAAACLYVKLMALPGQQGLARVASAFSEGDVFGARMKSNEHPDPGVRRFIAEEAARVYDMESERTKGNIIAAAGSYVLPYTDPLLGENTSSSDFLPSELMCSQWPLTVYLALNVANMDRLAPFARILFSQIAAELTADEHADSAGNPKRWNLLWALDEFPGIGKMPILLKMLAQGRSGGHRFLLGAQGLSQLRDIYGKYESITGLARLVVMRLSGLAEAKEVSALLGEGLETHVSTNAGRSSSHSWKGGSSSGSSAGHGVSTRWRPILPPEQVLRLPDDRLFLFGESKPILAWRARPEWWLNRANLPLAEAEKARRAAPADVVEKLKELVAVPAE